MPDPLLDSKPDGSISAYDRAQWHREAQSGSLVSAQDSRRRIIRLLAALRYAEWRIHKLTERLKQP